MVEIVLGQGGASRVRTTEHLVETVVLFRRQQWPLRDGVALVSTSGGRCSLLGDLASAVPLPLATFAPQTIDRLKGLLPDFGSPNNPLDPTGVVFDREGLYAPLLSAPADDPGVGLVGVYQVTRSINAQATGGQRTHRSVGLAGEVVEAARSTATPIVAFTSTSGGAVDPRVVEVLEDGAVPLLLGLESGLSAIGSAIKYAAFLRQPVSEAARDWSRPDVGRLLEMLQRDGAGGVVTYEQDWLGAQAQPVYDLSAPQQFMGNMASAAAQRGMTLQYCMPLPRHVLQTVEYGNVTTMRVSDDRFDRNRWDTFLYTSRLASGAGCLAMGRCVHEHRTEQPPARDTVGWDRRHRRSARRRGRRQPATRDAERRRTGQTGCSAGTHRRIRAR